MFSKFEHKVKKIGTQKISHKQTINIRGAVIVYTIHNIIAYLHVYYYTCTSIYMCVGHVIVYMYIELGDM